METRKKVKIYTDGACSGNPGPGGYCALLSFMGKEKIIRGGQKETTNNRMELLAVLNGLSSLNEACDVTLYSDSKYIIDAIDNGWAKKWRANGWMRNKKDPALNKDIWQDLLAILEVHAVTFVWVKGHSGHRENEICDQVAVEESMKYKNAL